ncbi:MAG: thiamine biosynthesis protein ThiC, partial [Candidatus Electrothrix sp. AR4]|nr:thiamine biosynthesis protein ThiC [Candidatus Electrothrix sp. AR4]
MKTQLELARAGNITEQIKTVARNEGLEPELVRTRVAAGEIVIANHPLRPQQNIVGIGTGLRTKVNASIGTSSDICNIDMEIRKARIAEKEGADTLMELSADGDFDAIRRAVLGSTNLPVGTVPLYQAFKETTSKYANPGKLDPNYLFDVIEQQLADGISFMAIHCGINQYTVERLRKQGYRYGGLVSKGGTFMVAWMDI